MASTQDILVQTLNQCCVFMGQNLVFNDIKDSLIACDLLPRYKADEISEYKGERNRIAKFIDYLIILDLEKWYQPFLDVLKDKRKDHIVEELSSKEHAIINSQGMYIFLIYIFGSPQEHYIIVV